MAAFLSSLSNIAPDDPLTGLKMGGCYAEIMETGTLTKVPLYEDVALLSSAPNPIVSTAFGKFPAFYFNEGPTVRVRLYRSNGTLASDEAWPVSGEVTEDGDPDPAPADPRTGAFELWPTTTPRTGYVRWNGGSIGSASSGATERANNDCEALYEFNWNNLDNSRAIVAGGRGTSAAADWAANKLMTLPSPEGHALAIADDMGAGAKGVIQVSDVTFGTAAAPVSKFGAMQRTLAEGNLPAHTHGAGSIVTSSDGGHDHGAGTLVTGSDGAHSHTYTRFNSPLNDNVGGDGPSIFDVWTNESNIDTSSNGDHSHDVSGLTGSVGGHSHVTSGNSASIGSGTAFSLAQPSLTVGLYQKL